MKPAVGALLNFFFSGLGYVVFGPKRLFGAMWTVGAIGLTYVELGIQTAAPPYYWPMFASVLLINTAFAIDGYMSIKAAAAGASGAAAQKAA